MKKINQNAIVKIDGYKVITTMTKLFVYAGEKLNKLIGCAGCAKPSDFDFDALYKFALHKAGSNLEIA